MTPTEFANLKYGNIISIGGFSGIPLRQLMVVHTNRDEQDNCTAIVALDCLLPADAEGIQVVDPTSQKTVLLNPNLGPSPDVLGILKTVLEK